jgi:hypothetical protein
VRLRRSVPVLFSKIINEIIMPVSLPPGRVQLASINFSGAVAQLGERLICIQEVVGSIPISSTSESQLLGL